MNIYIDNYIPTSTTEKVHFNRKYYVVDNNITYYGTNGTFNGLYNLKKNDNGTYIFKNVYCHMVIKPSESAPEFKFEGKLQSMGEGAGVIGYDKLIDGNPYPANLIFFQSDDTIRWVLNGGGAS